MPIVKTFNKSKSRRWKIRHTTGTGSTVTDVDSSLTTAWTDSVTYGDNLVDWKQRLQDGRDATTGLTVSGTKYKVKLGRIVSTRTKSLTPTGDRVWTGEGDFGLSYSASANSPLNVSVTRANNEALGRFVSKVNQVNTLFQGGVFLGELAEAIHGIRHPAQGLRDLVDAYWHRARKLRSVEGFRIKRIPFEKHLADLWLEHSFHWKPLFHDISDAFSAAAELTRNHAARPESRPVRAKGQVESDGTSTAPSLQANGGLRWYVQTKAVDSCTVVYRGAVRVEDISTLSGISRLTGFNPGSFIPTLWELLPYSFLIDYFSNVGDVISSLSFPKASLKWSNKTVVREVTVVRWTSSSPTAYVGTNYSPNSFRASRVEVTKRDVSRSSYTGSFIPSLQLEVPGSGSLKWLNIAALVIAQGSDRRFRWL